MTHTHPQDDRAVLANNYQQRFMLYTAGGESINLKGHYTGEPVVLLCGGPSLNTVDFDLLRASGITTMAMNNSWQSYKPDLWCCVDAASTFLDSGWADPSILKLAPVSEIKTRLRQKRDDDFVVLGKTPGRSPNTLFYKRSVGFQPDSFFTQPTANYGENGNRIDVTGIKGSRSVMLAALRLLYYLGFRRVYLVGADFHMDSNCEQYASGDSHGESLVRGNNDTYSALNHRLMKLRPYADDLGFSVTNCTPDSGLTAFDFEGLADVIEREKRPCPEGEDATGWYAKHNTQRVGELDHYLARDGKAYSQWHQKVYVAAASLVRHDKSSVLDVGCGTCFGLQTLNRSGWLGNYTGIDIDPTPVGDLPDDYRVITGDFMDSDLDESFDYVLCVEVFEHIQCNPMSFLKRLHGLTGSTLILSTPDKAKNLHGLFTAAQMEDMLSQVGFDLVMLPVGGTIVYICTKR